MRILIVEDEIVSRRFLEAILRKLDYTITSCSNGAEAWEAFQKYNFPIVICDWMMLVMDGIELCSRTRTRRRADQCYFSMLTARAGTLDIVESLAAGSDEHLSKPVDAGKLRDSLGGAKRLLATKTFAGQDLVSPPVTTAAGSVFLRVSSKAQSKPKPLRVKISEPRRRLTQRFNALM